MEGILNKRIKLTHINGMGNFNKDLVGVVASQPDRNHCTVRLDEDLECSGHAIREINISTRHEGKHLNKIMPGGIKKLLNIRPIISVSVVDKNNIVSFISEIILEEPIK